jgi:Holliday junction resolvase RusA-like endonuclease
MRAFVVKGRPILTTSARGLGEWTQKIAAAAYGQTTQLESPARVQITFYLPRPKSLKKSIVYPSKRPDVDKLARAVLDALTGITWRDDSQVTYLCVMKVYASGTCPPGAQIDIEYLNA